jgi:hypothetical protein
MTCMDGCLGAVPKTHAARSKRISPKTGQPCSGHFRTSQNYDRPFEGLFF